MGSQRIVCIHNTRYYMEIIEDNGQLESTLPDFLFVVNETTVFLGNQHSSLSCFKTGQK